jgi:hypothetical protein
MTFTKWNIFLLFLFLVSFVNAQNQLDRSYYPMNIGDYWTYYTINNRIGYQSQITGDTTMSNGKKYFIFRRVYNTYIQRDDTLTYERIDSTNHLLFYRTIDSSEVLIMDFNAQVHDTLKSYLVYYFGSTAYVGMKQKMKLDWWKEEIDGISLILKRPYDEDVYIIYGLNIGLMEDYRPIAAPFRLAGAKVKGKYYGIYSEIKPQKVSNPDDFTLYQNFPNPFNPQTEIFYKLTKKKYIEIKVFDILGKELKTLVSEMKNPGRYSISFDGKNLNSGVYICRINFNNSIKLIKMLLTK